MNRAVFCLFAAAFANCVLQAQTNPLITEMKGNYTSVKNNLIRAAEKMPEADYASKPADSVRTFGELIAHIAGAQARTCGAITGEQTAVDVSKTDKASLVDALKKSFDACDKAWDSMNDATAHEMIAGRGGQRTKLGTLIGISVVHNNEEYGYLAVYMRVKGQVPPSSDRR